MKVLKNLLLKLLSKFPLLGSYIERYPIKFYRNIKLIETDFPPEIWIENTNHCNAECVMCPRDIHTRKKGIMGFNFFSRLIKEISHYKDQVRRVHMHNFGEPLLDKNLYKKARLAKDLGIKYVYFVTNAYLLNRENSEKLIKSGVDEIKISFYGVDKSSYNSTMINLDFDTTLDNIKNFFRIRRELNAKNPKVVLQLLPQSVNNLEFQSKWMSIFSKIIDPTIGDSLHISHLQNFGDGREYVNIKEKTIRNTCSHPWREIVILQNGNVAPCCFDYNGTIKLGNVEEKSISEIWNSKQYKKIRQDFKELNYYNYPICKKCDVPYN